VVSQERHSVRDRVSSTLGLYLATAEKRIWFNSVRRDFHQMQKVSGRGDRELLISMIEKAKNSGVRVEMMVNAVETPFSPYEVQNSGAGSLKEAGWINRLVAQKVKASSDAALQDGISFFKTVRNEAPRFRIWSYFDYSHVKNLLMDEDFVLAGSYNPVDERSVDDAEIALFCQDSELNRISSKALLQDLVNGVPYPFFLSGSNGRL
jgi:phosphatidylserine/phosphatidylglycerophosphate/cardiolipin synthase-like enzyme